jgi:chromosome segregation ATPase
MTATKTKAAAPIESLDEMRGKLVELETDLRAIDEEINLVQMRVRENQEQVASLQQSREKQTEQRAVLALQYQEAKEALTKAEDRYQIHQHRPHAALFQEKVREAAAKASDLKSLLAKFDFQSTLPSEDEIQQRILADEHALKTLSGERETQQTAYNRLSAQIGEAIGEQRRLRRATLMQHLERTEIAMRESGEQHREDKLTYCSMLNELSKTHAEDVSALRDYPDQLRELAQEVNPLRYAVPLLESMLLALEVLEHTAEAIAEIGNVEASQWTTFPNNLDAILDDCEISKEFLLSQCRRVLPTGSGPVWDAWSRADMQEDKFLRIKLDAIRARLSAIAGLSKQAANNQE